MEEKVLKNERKNNENGVGENQTQVLSIQDLHAAVTL